MVEVGSRPGADHGNIVFTEHTRKIQKQTNKKQIEQNCTIIKLINVLTTEVACVTEVHWNLGIRLRSIFLMSVAMQVRAAKFYKSYPPATIPAGSNISN